MRPAIERRRGNHDRWLVSYADFITLLFGFFVVLYAFARADQKKQSQLPNAINQAFQSMGVSAAQSTPEPTSVVTTEQVRTPAEVGQDLNRMQRSLAMALKDEVQSGAVSLSVERTGLVISLRENGFFASGSATPNPQATATLGRIATSIGPSPYDVRVEGHTDNVPMHSAIFNSNWELSAARASAIGRLLLGLKAIPPERLSVAGYGEFHPVATNDTAEGRAQNRRVDLVVMPRTSIAYAAPQAVASNGAWRRVSDGDDPASQQVSESASQR
jgi:chemotaxis protein MotB